MAIVTSFFDQQRAGEINAIINNNFANVSKYIPIHFDSLTTVERLNLGDDWKQDGKLVYDMDQELVYIWDADSVEWVQHLLEAKDSYARALAQENQKKSFASVTLDENCQLIFKNSLGETVGTQLLTSDKIQYDSTDTIYTKIGKLMEQDAQMTEDIATINSKIFLENSAYQEIQKSCNKYWGKHSLLAILTNSTISGNSFAFSLARHPSTLGSANVLSPMWVKTPTSAPAIALYK